MLCHRCLRAAQRTRNEISHLPATSVFKSTPKRHISSTASQSATPVSPQAAQAPAPRQGSSTSHNPPAATSTSAAQPFSAGSAPSAKKLGIAKSGTPPAMFKSSVPAGTPLKGLNFIKGKQDPVAMEDSEYPAWLWTVLGDPEAKEKGVGGVDEADLFSKSAKARRRAAKALRKEQLLNPEALAPKIPLHEQSLDLPSGDPSGSFDGNVDARQAREMLTKSMRDKRRASIKEDNFLRTMG